MSRKRESGIFFILGFDGMEVRKPLQKIGQDYDLGGMILFGRNIHSPDQVRKLTTQLKLLASKEKLFISIDQEGGRFQRLRPPHFTAFPPACEVQKENALNVGQKMGKELVDLEEVMRQATRELQRFSSFCGFAIHSYESYRPWLERSDVTSGNR